MKRFLKVFLSLVLSFLFLVPTVAYGQTEEETECTKRDWVEADLTKEEIDEILSLNPNNEVQPLATGLIASGSLGISNNGTKINLVAQTVCSPEVVKSGFKEIVLQRRKNSSYGWSDFVIYEDLYANKASYLVTTSVTVMTGYQYRATCVHYAKKNLFSTETLNNVSNIVTVS